MTAPQHYAVDTERIFHRHDLVHIATAAMTERGLEPEFGASVLQQLATIAGAGHEADLRILDHG